MTASKVEVVIDEGLWVFAKPSGMAVHRSKGVDGPDLLTWARAHAGASAALAPIHRLDRHTSGVLLASEDPGLRASVGRHFADGEVRKRYLALVFGRTDTQGTIDRPLLDRRRGRKLEAVTRYTLERQFEAFSYLAVAPSTGRKHQIRRHLRGIRHSIVGDPRYGPPHPIPVPASPGRLWLHAHRIELPNGRAFEVALPDELAAHLDALAALEPAA